MEYLEESLIYFLELGTLRSSAVEAFYAWLSGQCEGLFHEKSRGFGIKYMNTERFLAYHVCLKGPMYNLLDSSSALYRDITHLDSFFYIGYILKRLPFGLMNYSIHENPIFLCYFGPFFVNLVTFLSNLCNYFGNFWSILSYLVKFV